MNCLKSCKPYFISGALLLVWWSLAFRQSNTLPPTPATPQITTITQPAPLLEIMSPLQRDTLKEALAGDYSLMIKLIADWDVDAQLLESRGVLLAKRLPRKDFIKAQLIARQLKKELRQPFQKQTIYDDFGNKLYITQPLTKFLPQTYIAATFLLTLTQPNQIVAIPSGLRDQTQFFPKALTDQIPLDIDRYNGEKLFHEKPDVAFVANYSHPHTLEALESQGIHLFTLKHFESVSEIQSALSRIGQIVNRSLEADLLNVFIDASMLAVDNRMLAFNHHLHEQGADNPRFLYLIYRSQYSLPTSRTLTGKLLDRLGVQTIAHIEKNQKEWFVPIYQEQIRRLNPDYLIVASSYPEMPQHLQTDDLMKELNAVKYNHTAYIDDDVQQSSTQYVILAYYDLFHAITKAHCP